MLIVFLFILQASCLAIIFPYPSTPDLFLLIIVSVALLFDFSKALALAVASGIIFDFLSFQKLGITSIILVLSVFSVSFLAKRFSIENRTGGFVSLILLMIILTFLYRFIVILVGYNFQDLLYPFKNNEFLENIWKEILFNLLFFIPIFYLIKKIRFQHTNTLSGLLKTK